MWFVSLVLIICVVLVFLDFVIKVFLILRYELVGDVNYMIIIVDISGFVILVDFFFKLMLSFLCLCNIMLFNVS